VAEVTFGDWCVLVVGGHQATAQLRLQAMGRPNEIAFRVGQASDHDDDRFLAVTLQPTSIQVQTDYAGSVPAFYSLEPSFVMSNIEPCIPLADGLGASDLDLENVYGFLRFGHYIWDETAWKGAFQCLPDCIFKFRQGSNDAEHRYLASIQATQERSTATDKEVADAFYELNRHLVGQSLSNANSIILPLSSGYDSRLILAAVAENPHLRERLSCFTYGDRYSIEVLAAEELAKATQTRWTWADLPARFLELSYLDRIGRVFGSSLHMHGMYQIEFYEFIRKAQQSKTPLTLTSGFMSGVPAGQHISLLAISAEGDSLVRAMNNFSQSNIWSKKELDTLDCFRGNTDHLENLAEERFRRAFQRFDGSVAQRSVMFDVWTRQRAFISYHPRTFEWLTHVRSPHMNPDYANFFMSLRDEHLHDRRAVELMLMRRYPQLASIRSNSNRRVGLAGPISYAGTVLAKMADRLGMRGVMPTRFRDDAFDLDSQAVRNCHSEALYPFNGESVVQSAVEQVVGNDGFLGQLVGAALGGSSQAYQRLVGWQALAFDIQIAQTGRSDAKR